MAEQSYGLPVGSSNLGGSVTESWEVWHENHSELWAV